MIENIENTIEDLVSDFLYYDRKEDEDLPVGEIETQITTGKTSIKEIVAIFEEKLKEGLNI